ncbi:MAG: PA14 domain-containing protein [Deltaproteobacteria bacterium]|nr:PA14 domain-containing protein [Deltaproteobacteria bacterium]
MRRTFILIFFLFFSLVSQVWAMKTAEQLKKEIDDLKGNPAGLGQTLGQAQNLLNNAANGIDGVIAELKRRGVTEEEIQKVVQAVGVDPRTIANNIRGVANNVPTSYEGFLNFREQLKAQIKELNDSKTNIEREASKERDAVRRITAEIEKIESSKRSKENTLNDLARGLEEVRGKCIGSIPASAWERMAMCALVPYGHLNFALNAAIYNTGIVADAGNIGIQKLLLIYPKAIVDLNDIKARPYGLGLEVLQVQFDAINSAIDKIDREVAQKKKDYLCKDRDRGTAGGWVGEYFNNKTLSGEPLIIKRENFLMLSENWKTGNVKAHNWEYSANPVTGSDTFECGMNADNWSARWQYKITSDGGVHKFTTTTDDGVRLWVNGIKIIDDWRDHAPTTHTVTVPLPEGNIPLKVEFYDSTHGAMIDLRVESIPGCATVRSGYIPMDHWKGEYFANKDLQGAPSMIKDDGAAFLNFDWGNVSPNAACSLPADNWSVKWTRAVPFENKTYRFKVTTDDGMRLYVDGIRKIDQWKMQAPTDYFVDVPLTAGNHTIKIEYYDSGWGATAKVSWELAPNCNATVPAGHWKGEYFNNVTMSGTPILTRDDGSTTLNFNWQMASPNIECGVNTDNWSTRWTRSAPFENKTYVFTATTDDGMRVYVDGVQKINEWKMQGPTTYTANVPMTAGNHTIKVEYYDSGWGATAKLDWRAIAGPTPTPSPPPVVAPPPQAAPAPRPRPTPPRRYGERIQRGSAEGMIPLPPPPPPSEVQNSGTSPTQLPSETSPTKLPQEEPTPVRPPQVEEATPKCDRGTWSATFGRCMEEKPVEETKPQDCERGTWSPTLKICVE